MEQTKGVENFLNDIDGTLRMICRDTLWCQNDLQTMDAFDFNIVAYLRKLPQLSGSDMLSDWYRYDYISDPNCSTT